MQKKSLTRDKVISDRLARIVILSLTVVFLVILWDRRQALYGFRNLGLIGLFLVNVLGSATVLLPLPSIATVFIGGSLWNPLFVGIIAGMGNATGELVGFFLGFGGRGFIDKIDTEKVVWLKKFEVWFKRSGFVTIFILSAFPDPLFDLVGILAGSLNYPIWKFFLATAAGRIFRNLIVAWSGARIIP